MDVRLQQIARPTIAAELVTTALVFALGVTIRLIDLSDAPLDFHPSRQLHSAVIARGMYFLNLDSATEWQRQFALTQWEARGLIEPPILEFLASTGYQILGGEYLWLPRVASIGFWTIGGIGLYLLTRDMVGRLAALVAILFYFFSPYSILASRAFMPDPLMTALLIWSVLYATRWARLATPDGNGPRAMALGGGVLTGIAILSKSVAVFPLLAIWLAALAAGPGIRNAVRSRHSWIIAGLAVLPSLVFYAYGLFVTQELQQQFSGRFFPSLWLEPRFYVGWLANLDHVIGTGWLVFSLLGALILRDQAHRAIALAWWGAYLVYGFVFAWHISTHDYYTLWIVPAVAIGLGSAVDRLASSQRWLRILGAMIVVAGLVVPAHRAYFEMVDTNWSETAEMWESLGSRIEPEAQIVSLTDDYGLGLAYWGWRGSEVWLSEGDLLTKGESREDGLLDLERALYGKDLFVITDFASFDSEDELKEHLLANHRLLAQETGYWIFELNDLKAP